MVKLKLLLLFMTIGSLGLFAQDKSKVWINVNKVESFVHQIHETNSKSFIVQNKEGLEEMKNFIENNVFFIQYKNIPQFVTESLSDYQVINMKFVQTKFDPKSFNPFLYRLEQSSEAKKIHIEGTNYVLFVYPTTQD